MPASSSRWRALVSSCHWPKPISRLLAHGEVRRQHPRTPQHGVDPGKQFAGGEGLGQVVVGAHLQADDAVGLVVARGEHQHRRGLVLADAQLAAEQQAVVAGHHDVEDDQVHRVGFEERAHLPAIGDDGGAQAVLLQVVAYQLANLAVIVDDQDVIDMLHCLAPVAVGVLASSVSAPAALPAGVCIALYPEPGRIPGVPGHAVANGETTDGAGRDSSGGSGAANVRRCIGRQRRYSG